jgi:hypothetical protein
MFSAKFSIFEALTADFVMDQKRLSKYRPLSSARTDAQSNNLGFARGHSRFLEAILVKSAFAAKVFAWKAVVPDCLGLS